MNIGIIIFSHTGNTNSVALKLKDRLQAAGHSVKLERITVNADYKPGSDSFQLKTKPEVNAYDALILGAPVWAFSLATVMKSYLMQIESLKNKKVACYVTHFFPYNWMGGKGAVGRMIKICKAKGAAVGGSGIIGWAGKKRRQRKIKDMVEKLSSLF
ncbi:MAG: flavodoxin family protein [Spirochaetales bacterium]|nr:flavodoxin family protein [Spirochaetales bacterium]